MGASDLEVVGNLVGAAFWLAVAVLVGFRVRQNRGQLQALGLVATILLARFGISDLIEARTGVWWRPFRLLAWKGICLTGLILCVAVAWWLTRAAHESGPTGWNKMGDA
jgi:hypothetical protein